MKINSHSYLFFVFFFFSSFAQAEIIIDNNHELSNGIAVYTPTWSPISSNNNVLAGAEPSAVGPGNFTLENSGGIPILTDGLFQGITRTGQHPAFATVGANNGGRFVEYNFPATQLHAVITYGGWNDAGRDQQKYDILYSTNGGATFDLLASIDFNPVMTGAQSALQIMVTDNSGPLENGAMINALRFDFNQSVENGHIGLAEVSAYSASFEIGNRPPRFSENPLLIEQAFLNAQYSGSLIEYATDPDDDPITFEKTTGPEWLKVAQDGTLSGTPTGKSGINQFTIEAADGEGSGETTLLIRVIDPNAKPSNDLFGWWPLNDGEGGSASDISGNELSANIFNFETGGLGDGGSAWAEDPDLGIVLSFNGTDNSGTYAVVGTPPDFGALPQFTIELESEFTWSFWAKSEQGSNNDVILGNRWSPTGGDFSPRQFIKFTTRMFEWDTNNVQGLDYEDIPQGVWMHHVVIKQGTELTYYRDGIRSGTRTIVAAPSYEQPLYFGGQGRENWQGYLFDIRLFNNALTEDEILDVFSKRGVFRNEGGLEFTSINLDAERNLMLSWRSQNRATYALDFSTKLKSASELDGWTELDDGIVADGEITTFTIPADEPPFPKEETKLFFRVREVE